MHIFFPIRHGNLSTAYGAHRRRDQTSVIMLISPVSNVWKTERQTNIIMACSWLLAAASWLWLTTTLHSPAPFDQRGRTASRKDAAGAQARAHLTSLSFSGLRASSTNLKHHCKQCFESWGSGGGVPPTIERTIFLF
jgi:hypothetical protein